MNQYGKYLVGLDEGTTGCKACVFDLDGNLMGSEYREYPCVYYPDKPGYVEQRAEDILAVLFDCVKIAIFNSKIDANEIIAIGLSSQGATVGMTDTNGNAIRNFISWQDCRGGEFTEEMLARMSAEEFYAITGWNIESSILPVAKHLWLQKNEPELYEKAARFVTHQEFFLKHFGADGWFTDSSSICREGIGEVNQHNYSQKIFDVFEMDLSKRGSRVANGTIVGEISKKNSELTGLPIGCKICVGAMDSDASPYGCGLIRPKDAVIVMGTFGACFVCSDKPIRDPNPSRSMVKSHTYFEQGPNTFTIEGSSAASASAFRWFRDNFATLETSTQAATGFDAYELLTAQIHNSQPGANGVSFLPFLQGRMGCGNNPEAKGALVGMRMSTTRADLIRAVLEGICYEMREVLTSLQAADIEIGDIRLSGGVAKSPLWVQMQADIYQRPVKILHTHENGCLGAALLAGIGTGVYKNAFEAVDTAVKFGKTYEPNLKNKALYDEGYHKFESAYQGLATSGF